MAVPTRFVGRDVVCSRLEQLVARRGLVTVTGPGGVGKTRLVTEACNRMGDRLSGRVAFAWLAELPTGADADAVAAAAGFESAEAAGLVLAERPQVLVLDNCEHVLGGASSFLGQVFDIVESVTVIATSRAPLGVFGEQVLVLDPLDLPAEGGVDAEASPAVQLFLDRAAAAGAVLTPSTQMSIAVGELCRRLDGLPLAIELAAARTRVIGPAELLALMDQRLDILRRGRQDEHRHDSMRAAIDVSASMLSRAERAFFRRLAGFTGPFDLALAHAVAGEGDDRLSSLETLSQLVERSLVVAEHSGPGTRYRLLELLRDHAREQLVAAGEVDSAEERFIDAMAAVADRIVVDGLTRWSGELLASASSQFANLVHACELCTLRDDSPARALRLLVPMFAAVHDGKPGEVRAIGARVFERWPEERAPWRAEALAVLATAAALEGQNREVHSYADAALADPECSRIAVAVVERALGFATRDRDAGEAARHFERARRAAADAGFVALEREVVAFSAAQRDLIGESADAMATLRDVIDRSHREEDVFGEALGRLLLTRALLRAGRLDDAAAEVATAEAVCAATGLMWFRSALLRTRAEVAAHGEGGWPAAARVCRRAVDFAASEGALGELAITLRSAAVLARRSGHPEISLTLASAIPGSGAITVLPELFPAEAAEVAAHTTARPPRSLVEALRKARAALDGETTAAPSAPAARAADTVDKSAAAPAVGRLRAEGDTWLVSYNGASARLRHLKGLVDLAVLLSRPRTEVHCLELMGAVETGSDAGPLLDDRARREYQRRIIELQTDIDEARADNDPARAERSEAELDVLVQQLSAAFGLSGRGRSTGSSVERARTAVTYRIRAAQRRIAEVLPELGRHLDNAVRTGTWCSYQPETETTWAIEQEG